MSERLQHTAASMREKMLVRYGTTLHHKHDKNHIHYRQHCRTHPVQKRVVSSDVGVDCSTGLVREFKFRKIRKRLDRGRFH